MIYAFHDCALDEQRYELRRCGVACKLEPKVFELLLYLVKHHDHFVSREELIEALWPDVVVGEAVLTQCIAKARKAVADDGEKQQVIKTQHGRGYRFVAPISKHEQQAQDIIKTLPESVGFAFLSRMFRFPELKFFTWGRQLAYGRSAVAGLFGLFLILGTITMMRVVSLSSPVSAKQNRFATIDRRISEHRSERTHHREWRLSRNNPDASSYGIRAWDYYERFIPETNTQARRLFKQAIARDPQYAAAYVGVGWTYLTEWSSLWTYDPHSLDKAWAFAQKGLAANNTFAHAYILQAYVYLLQRRYEHALTASKTAVALDPTCADCYATLADVLTFTGQPRRAIDLVGQARALDPSSSATYAAILGRAYYLIGQADLAVETLRRAVTRNPNALTPRLTLALAYSEVGCGLMNEEETREAGRRKERHPICSAGASKEGLVSEQRWS
ncbi:MAG: tetratricopeptide repeat protein [Deltaproteobacteria bacterium]|nr:tetratricopeptide repeat protein [Deltaproteobacteria bacterium]